MVKTIAPSTLGKGLADLSINLSSGWLGILLISPGFYGIAGGKYVELLLINLPPALLAFLLGVFIAERSEQV